MLIYVIAGEPSGDLLAGRVMAALQQSATSPVRFAGIGGESMQANGLQSLFPMSELTVMGLVEVLPRIPNILRRVRQTLDHIECVKPDAILTIDSWGFTGRIQSACKQRFPDIPRIHYVAPMVWAWKPKRAAKLASVLDLLLTLLPFEPPWFQREGLRTVHVGHSVIESEAGSGDGAAFRCNHGLTPTQPLLVVLPGSRGSEIGQLLPILRQTVQRLKDRQPDLTLAVPTVPHLADRIAAETRSWPFPVILVAGQSAKYDCFAAGSVAVAASGTVALELAMAGLPAVILYRVSPVTAFLARRIMGFKAKWASLVNMVMDQPVMPEFLQENCQPDSICDQVLALLNDPADRARRRDLMADAMSRLGMGHERPGQRAAEAILNFIAERNKNGLAVSAHNDPSGGSGPLD